MIFPSIKRNPFNYIIDLNHFSNHYTQLMVFFCSSPHAISHHCILPTLINAFCSFWYELIDTISKVSVNYYHRTLPTLINAFCNFWYELLDTISKVSMNYYTYTYFLFSSLSNFLDFLTVKSHVFVLLVYCLAQFHMLLIFKTTFFTFNWNFHLRFSVVNLRRKYFVQRILFV
jgi:hypothetical protein